MTDDKIQLNNDAVEKLFGSLMMNFVTFGEQEAIILEGGELTKEQAEVIMKSNTLLTVATMYFMMTLQEKDLDTMRKVLTIWTSPMIQDLVNIAFENEIKAASDEIDSAIEKMEKEANKDAPTK